MSLNDPNTSSAVGAPIDSNSSEPVPKFSIVLNPEAHAVKLSGAMRLPGLASYEPIKAKILACLEHARNLKVPSATIDMKDLAFVNSSGINMLSRVILEAKAATSPSILIVGSKSVAWQFKSLSNFVKLWPSLRLELH